MIKHSLIILSVFLLTSTLFISCSNDDDDDYLGDWEKMSTLDGVPRTNAVCFVIGNKAYVGTGYDTENKERLKDFWVYDGDDDSWTSIAPLPAEADARNGAVAFSSSTKGYVGTGYNGDDKLNDFWEYDPASDTWTQKSDFPGSARYDATAFYVNGNGYIGTGYDDREVKDLWKYDIDTDSWTQVESFKGEPCRKVMNFVINGEAYVFGGLSDGGYLDEMFKYDAQNDDWVEMSHLSDYEDDGYDDDYTIYRYDAATFIMDGKGYVTTGYGTNSSETWEYEPSTDRWEQKTNFEGTSRNGAVGFTLNNQGYVTTGGNGSYSFRDIWKLSPFEEYDSKD